MQICQEHWHELKNAIRQRGLWRLVTPSGYLAAETPEEILELNAAQFKFDPLMAASHMIGEQARAALGAELETGIHCPLCEVDRHLGAGESLRWIEADADMILHVCRERHLVEAADF
ncbi:MAG TPA: hypothetical protein VK900_10920 [Anaerolineales bacterium]|nr:hypothetical protein [Anaerolineales bacterium]